MVESDCPVQNPKLQTARRCKGRVTPLLATCYGIVHEQKRDELEGILIWQDQDYSYILMKTHMKIELEKLYQIKKATLKKDNSWRSQNASLQNFLNRSF